MLAANNNCCPKDGKPLLPGLETALNNKPLPPPFITRRLGMLEEIKKRKPRAGSHDANLGVSGLSVDAKQDSP